ncbi:putative HTH crp-type domain-containing protein [Pararobbsia alpina]|uniref:type IV toxin-antitoxin system AbiEi family antitoxin n=1 Tax=Pararobbsia alpina TaxID=621374 RepID=UPI0039A5871E
MPPSTTAALKRKTLNSACSALEQTVRSIHATPGSGSLNWPEYIDGFTQLELPDGAGVAFPVVIIPMADGSALVSRYLSSTAIREMKDTRPVLVASFVSTKTAESLIGHSIEFMDTAGNAYLQKPGLTVMVTSRPKPHGVVTRSSSKATFRRGLEITFVLLVHPTALHQTLQRIADLAGAAVSTTKGVIDDLMKRGTLSLRSGKRWFPNRGKASEEWMANYASMLRPQLTSTRFTSSDPKWWRDFDFAKHHALLGGEPAAEVLTGEMKARDVTLYVDPEHQSALVKQARLRADPNGEIEIIEPFWRGWYKPEANLQQPIVPPLLICADLMRTSDERNLELAKRIYDEFLRDT